MMGGFAIWYLWWCYHIPLPTEAATVLAVIAAIMAYRGEPEGFEKMFWTIVLFAFLFLELHAIQHKDAIDQQSNKAAQEGAEAHFRDIGKGITRAIEQGNEEFRETVDQESRDFAATMSKAQANLDAITGGSSYVVVCPDLTNSDVNVFHLGVRVCNKCEYSVPSASVYVDGKPIYSGTVRVGSIQTVPSVIVAHRDNETVYRIQVVATNKPTFEKLSVRYNPRLQRWECKWRIEQEVRRPHYNPITHMAEGEVLKVLEDSPWTMNTVTVANPKKTTIVQ